MPKPLCPLCGGELRVTSAKNHRPFQLCTSGCGLQILLRTQVGVDRFEKKYGTSWRGAAAAAPVAKAAPAAAAAVAKTPAKPFPRKEGASVKEAKAAETGARPKPRRGFFDFD